MEDQTVQPTAPNMINLTTNNDHDGLENGNFFKLWLILGMNNSYINFSWFNIFARWMRGPGREREWCTLCSGWVGPWDLKVLTLLFDGSEIRLTSWYGKYPNILWFTRVLYIPDGAGFCSINSSSLTCVMQVTIGSIWASYSFKPTWKRPYYEDNLLICLCCLCTSFQMALKCEAYEFDH